MYHDEDGKKEPIGGATTGLPDSDADRAPGSGSAGRLERQRRGGLWRAAGGIWQRGECGGGGRDVCADGRRKGPDK